MMMIIEAVESLRLINSKWTPYCLAKTKTVMQSFLFDQNERRWVSLVLDYTSICIMNHLFRSLVRAVLCAAELHKYKSLLSM
jgi:hypothetical protein